MSKKFVKFKIREVFEIKSSNGIFHAVNIDIYNKQEKGMYPYIVRTSQNNGIRGYIKQNENKLNEANTISFAQDTAECFYQNQKYFTGNKIKIFKLKGKEITEEIAIYLLRKIKDTFKKYGWGSSFDTKLLENEEITLPIKDNIEEKKKYEIVDIDYEYMEERIKELEKYLEVSGLENYELTKEDEEVLGRKVEFKEFKLSDIFEASNGDIDLQQKDVNDKGEYIITSGDSNCGILGKTDREAKIFDKNTITVDMFGSSYFRDFKYKMVTHARVFSLKRKDKVEIKLNEGLYYISRLKTLKQKHSYNNMCSWKKAQDTIITLPITEEGQIDYEYMDNYIQAIKKKTIAGVVKYKDQVIEITKKVVAKTNKR